MGLGHVSPRPLPRSRSGPHVPRRQRRGVGEVGAPHLNDARRRLGVTGERLAAWFLSSHGLKILESNLPLPDGEIDLLALDGIAKVAIEVRTTSRGGDPIDAVDHPKRLRVKRLSAALGASRSDFLGIRVAEHGIDFHWVQN